MQAPHALIQPNKDEEMAKNMTATIIGGMFGYNPDNKPKEEGDYTMDDLFVIESEGPAPHSTLGREILIAIATEPKKFKIYVGLVDMGTSASLIDQAIAEQYESVEVIKEETMRKTQAGTFPTTG